MKIAEIKGREILDSRGSGCYIGIRDYGPCLCPIGCVNR